MQRMLIPLKKPRHLEVGYYLIHAKHEITMSDINGY